MKMNRFYIFTTIALTLLAPVSPARPTIAKQRVHVITNPRVSLDGYTIYKASAKVNDPRAQDPAHIYLILDKDAVRLAGPKLSSADGVDVNALFVVNNPTFQYINRRPYSADGIRVQVNDHLVYEIYARDYEHEVELARVKLIKEDGMLKTWFIFASTGDGVSWDMQLSVLVDGVKVRTRAPFTIESRRH